MSCSTELAAAQMDRWCKDFDNWAFCDAMSFNLFDRSPHAWAKVAQWSKRGGEFEKRTAFCRRDVAFGTIRRSLRGSIIPVLRDTARRCHQPC